MADTLPASWKTYRKPSRRYERYKMKALALNTSGTSIDSDQIKRLLPNNGDEVEFINTSDMKIAHCIGCNQCWLKTPGICAIKDDYETIVKRLVQVRDLWIISDTRFGFLDFKGKRVLDRIMPMLNMYLEFRDGWMRHQLRYHILNVGIIYQGHGDQALLTEWCERASHNLGGRSLGVFAIHNGKEAAPCM